jgi:hypothetical protein
MKSRLSVLAAVMLLPAALPTQAVSLSDSPLTPFPPTPLTLLSDNSPAAVAPTPLVCAPLPAGAVAWWRAESNTVDTVGVNDLFFTGYLSKGLTYTTGKVGTAFRFIPNPNPFSTVNYLYAPLSPELDVGAGAGLTIEGWFSPSTVIGVKPIAEWNDGHGNIGAGLALNVSALEASLTDTNASPARRVVFRSALGVIASLGWHHVAFTFDKTAGHAIAYVDGIVVAQTNLLDFRPATQATVYLGYRPSGMNADALFSGGLDELTIYNRALTVDELQSIVAAGTAGKCVPPPPPPVPTPAGIVGWWRGESNALDSVDSNQGVITGSVSYVTSVVGNGFQFLNGYVRIPATSNLNLGLGPGFTIETWALPGDPRALPFPSKFSEFVGWHNGATHGVSLVVTNVPQPRPPLPDPRPVTYSTVWQATLLDTHGTNHIIRAPAGLTTAGAWQHVALTYDKASGVAVLCFNGNPVTQTNLGSFTPQTAADLNLGYQEPLPIPGRLPYGSLDEASLYARALSPAEIRSIMLARGAGKSKDPPIIIFQPASLRANLGAAATFTVTAGGNPILKYQWRRNSVALAGATGSALVLTNLQSTNAGIYSLRITNAFGVALSSNAVLTINRAPVADASATQPLAIAPLHCDATVVLDGSRSSDPDSDPLHYYWFKAGATSPFATGMVAVVTLPVGVNPLILVADDGLATNSQSFTVEVLTLAQAVERLITLVNSEALKPHPLVASLSAALSSIERSSPTSAVNQLQAFQNKVGAQVAPSNPVLAQTFNQSAQQLVVLLSTDCSPAKPKATMAKVARQADGKLRMRFSAPHGFVYILEASTNLIDWDMVGVTTDRGSGEFDAEDLAAPQLPARFYRLVVP